MDLLKQELQNKREAVTEGFGGRSFVRRSELEQKQIQTHRKQLLLSTKASAPASSADSALGDRNNTGSSAAAAVATVGPALATTKKTMVVEEHHVDDVHLPRHEVVWRLRVLRQPATLFGEDDAVRVDRLKSVLNSSVDLDDLADMTQGQTNDFLPRDVIQMRKRHKAAGAGRDAARAKCCRRKGSFVVDTADDEDNASADEDCERMNARFDDLCKEDKILVFFKRLLNKWKQELDGMGELQKRTAEGKTMVERYNECALYLEPLFDFCRKKVVPGDICQALFDIVECCMNHDYLVAIEQYIKLTIGNAAWPMGVTMVGIHERSAREKIHTNSVAHIMNDETTRRYLHSIKRLVTLCQPRYPGQP